MVLRDLFIPPKNNTAADYIDEIIESLLAWSGNPDYALSDERLLNRMHAFIHEYTTNN